jgi:predicted nucleic acid-binding protein
MKKSLSLSRNQWPMVSIDSNVFVYGAGAAHPNKIPTVRCVHRAARGEMDACTSVAILQEILHRYRYMRRWRDGKQVFILAKKIIPVIVPIDPEILDRAFELLEKHPSLCARDAVHAVTCLSMGVREICSYDAGFDGVDYGCRAASRICSVSVAPAFAASIGMP